MTFLSFILVVNGQQEPKQDSINVNKKAVNAFGDVTKLLAKNTNYPVARLGPRVYGDEGDVLLSLWIRKSGKSDSLSIVSSVGLSFSTSAMVAFSKLPDEWHPAILNGEPVDKRYLIVFRFRKYLNTQPYDYKGKIEQLLTKGKYKMALKQLNSAIHDNKYDSKLFDSRAKAKQFLGDEEGAKADHLASKLLQEEILALVEINVVGVTTTKTVFQTTSTPIRRIY